LPATQRRSSSPGSAARSPRCSPTSPVSPRWWRPWSRARSDRCSTNTSRA
jgi:hypothetical protein